MLALASCGHNPDLDVPLSQLTANGWIDFITVIIVILLLVRFIIIPIFKDNE